MDEWDIYFATIVGMQLHPGYTREGTEPLTIEQCAQLADKMMEVKLCRSQQR